MTDEPPDVNDMLRHFGADATREILDRAERKVVPLREADAHVVKPERLAAIDMTAWDHMPVPEPDWVVHNRIPRRQTCLFSGEGAMGKSTLLLQLCCAHVLARDWLGTMPEFGPALFFDAEDDPGIMHRRLAAVVQHYGVRFADLVRGGLTMVSRAGEDALLAVVNRAGKVEPTPLYGQLVALVSDLKPVMIGLASAANVFAGNENSRPEVQQFIGLLTRLAILANGSVVLVSHPSVTGIATNSGLSGSTAWHNSVRARFFLRGVKPKESDDGGGEPDNDLRELEFRKNNYGPVAETLTLRWQHGLFLPEPKQSGLQLAAQQQRDDDVFVAILSRFVSQNRYVSPSRSVTYAPSVFAAEREARSAACNAGRLKTAMDRLIENGRVVVVTHGSRSRERQHLELR